VHNILQNNFNKLLILLYIILTIGIVFFITHSTKNQIQSYKLQQNTSLSQNIHTEVATLIAEKKDATLAMAILWHLTIYLKMLLKQRIIKIQI
jgi:two-component system, sensor histidine kinase and response regulator